MRTVTISDQKTVVEYEEKLVRNFDTLSVYQSVLWSRVLQEGFGVNTSAVVTYDDQKKPIAYTKVYFKKKFGIKLIGSPLPGTFTEFCGTVFDEGLSSEAMVDIFHDHLKKITLIPGIPTELLLPSHFQIPQSKLANIVERQRLSYSERRSRIINLELGLDVVWSGFQSRARGAVRKAEKTGVKCSVAAFSKSWPIHHEMVSATFKKQGLNMPHSQASYEALGRNLDALNSLLFVVATLNGEIVSSGLFILDRGRMNFHSGATTQIGNKNAAASAVQWFAMKEAVKRKIHTYDIGGLGLESIDKFKVSFGGDDIHHHRIYLAKPWFAILLRFGRWLVAKGALRVFK